MQPSDAELIYDWNCAEGDMTPARGRIALNDETLRDGLQSPSVKTPSIEQKLEILHGLAAIGIDSLNIGRRSSTRSSPSPPTARRALSRPTSGRSSRSRSAPVWRSRSPASSARRRSASTPKAGR
jgi:hypothetical protein